MTWQITMLAAVLKKKTEQLKTEQNLQEALLHCINNQQCGKTDPNTISGSLNGTSKNRLARHVARLLVE
jgi:hypothetical protein